MTVDEGFNKLIDIIRYDLRPAYYEETIAIADEAKMYHAKDSEKQRKALEQVRKSENEEQKDQRVRLTNAITSVALGPVYSYAEAVWRTDGVTKYVSAENVPESIRQRVSDHFRYYYKDADLHRYCFEAALHYTKVDPNAWTVFEATFGEGERGESIITDFYPVEVMSSEVRGYDHNDSGVLQYLAFEFKRKVYDPENPKQSREVSDFFLYAAGFSIHFAEIDQYYTDNVDYEALGYVQLPIRDTARRFWSRPFLNTLTEVPAIRWSAYGSTDHNRKIGETLVASAIPLLEELLKDNSLLQLIKYIHAYPEKYQYVRRCNHRDETGRECLSGYYGGTYYEKDKCKQCKGSGKLMVASEQDIITLAYPDRAEDIFELSKLSHYVERPIEILEQYREIVREHQTAIMAAVYNQQNVDPRQLTQAETATQVRLEYDKIYNKLAPFAEMICLAWEKGQRCGFEYYGYMIDANMTYPHDFKMKGIMELLMEYDASANAPYAVRQSIANDIITKQYRNAPEVAKNIQAFQRWKPWKDKSAEEIALIVNSRATNDPDRVLWENWTRIMEIVSMDLAPLMFFELPDDEQMNALYAAVGELTGQIQYPNVPDPFMSFAGVEEGEESDDLTDEQ